MQAAENIWMLAIATGVLAGWWLAVRPGAAYRSISTPMSCLIVLTAVLMTVLAVQQQTPSRAAAAQLGVLCPETGLALKPGGERSRTLP